MLAILEVPALELLAFIDRKIYRVTWPLPCSFFQIFQGSCGDFPWKHACQIRSL